ncbi:MULTISPECIES: response regulator [Zobellia]|uniref:Two-component system-Response regulator n=1 Tax=Zobellia galactanivorans (strain DSM 12802 / CCUG 47099 / CIP 106680 / NCIMB 13871 / Dsij) TaxID=63186 RepID=G0L342_ZOBGA|nr:MULTISPECIES: response regulator [Zobellia]OWW26252.1 response regulator [Zobellia sp. OII3]CAZ95186.1 Two-component system-Response regulator [Zobellia galactanivorans]
MTTKVLIVEDNLIIQMFIEHIITNVGSTHVKTADNGEDALYIIESYMPDVVLLDIGLSGTLNGIETATFIKEKYKIPFVYITGSSDLGTLESARKTGPIHILKKPIDEYELTSEFEIIRQKLYESKFESSK